MGENFISKKAKHFRHLSDRARVTELEREHLFLRAPKKMDVHYPCRLHSGIAAPALDENLSLCDGGSGEIQLLERGVPIGTVDGSPAQELRDVMKADLRCGGFIKVSVAGSNKFGREVQLRIEEGN